MRVIPVLIGLLIVGTAEAKPNAPKKDAAKGPGPKMAAGMVVEGEKLTVRQIPDPSMGGMSVGAFLVPEKWRDQSKVVWNYGNDTPVQAWGSFENPANAETYFYFPMQEFYTLRPVLPGYRRQGEIVRGSTFLEPMKPANTAAMLVQKLRGRMPKFQMIGSKDLPELAAALALGPAAKGTKGVGVKVTYELDGKPVEEELYALYYLNNIPYDGPQGRTWQVNWGLLFPHSFRAPLGTLDKRRPVFAAISKSYKINPAWEARYKAISAYLVEQFNQQLKAGYDQIAAAGRLSQQISANNDRMLSAIDSRLKASQATSSPQARSANDKFSDYIRGVDTVDDPKYGTSQHSSTEQYHWTDGYGSYRHSNDGSYDPNRSENGGWTLMQPSR